MVEVLKQGQYAMLPVELQIMIIYAGTSGALDNIPLDQVARYEQELFAFLRASKQTLLQDIREKGKLRGKAFEAEWPKLEEAMKAAVREFGERFVVKGTEAAAMRVEEPSAQAAAC